MDDSTSIDTGGGTSIGGGGSVGIETGDFINRDRYGVNITNNSYDPNKTYTNDDIVRAIVGDPLTGHEGLRQQFTRLERRMDGMEQRLGDRITNVEQRLSVEISGTTSRILRIEETVQARNANQHRVYIPPWLAVLLGVTFFIVAVIAVAALLIAATQGGLQAPGSNDIGMFLGLWG